MTSQSESRLWLSPLEAAARAEVHKDTIIAWCIRYQIGRKVAGRWRVNTASLDRFVAGVDSVNEVRAA